MRSIENLLTVGTLHHLSLLLYGIQPVIGVHRFHRVRECWRVCPLKLTELVTALGLTTLLLHLRHVLMHGLEDLGLQCHELLNGGRLLVVVVVVVGVGVAGVGHLEK